MREIKFRAWHDKKMWTPATLQQMLIAATIPHTNARAIEELRGNWRDVVFQQYTGLKDKNGVEIYEGDILCSDLGDVGAVEFHAGQFTVDFSYPESLATDFEHSEVIGNIYEATEPLLRTKPTSEHPASQRASTPKHKEEA